MGATGFSFEFESPVAPSRMFKASVLDAHNLAPKIMPDVYKSAELLKGDGGVSSIKQYNHTEAMPFSHAKERVDLLDKEKMEYKCSVIEGEDVGTKLISAGYHVKVGPSGKGGGSVCRMSGEYQPAPGVNMPKEEVNMGKAQLTKMFKGVEAYLLANPQAYA